MAWLGVYVSSVDHRRRSDQAIWATTGREYAETSSTKGVQHEPQISGILPLVYRDALRHVEYDFRANVREELCGLLDHLASFGNVLREPLPSPSGESSSVQLNGTHVAVRDQLPKRQRSLA
jgi:hypothetical protein